MYSTNMDYGLPFKVTWKIQHVHFLHLYPLIGLVDFSFPSRTAALFERVRVFRLMTARDNDNSMMLVIAFTNSCSFLFLYVFISLVPFLFLVSALPHGRRHRQTTLVVHSLWNPRAGRQEYKRKHEHISFSQVLSFLSCIIRTTVVEKEFTFLK